MRERLRRPGLVLGLAMCLLLGVGNATARGQEGGGEGRRRLRGRAAWRGQSGAGTGKRGPHGGVTSTKAGLTFEFIVQEKAIKVYVTDAKGKAISAKGFVGKVNLGVVRRDLTKGANHQGASAKLSYVGKSKSRGRLRSYLLATHALGKADRQGMRVDLVLTSVPGRKGGVEATAQIMGTTPEVRFVCTGACQSKKKPPRYYDPGQCPKCEAELAREGSARAKAKARGSATPDGDGAEQDGEHRPRRPWRRWPRRKR